MVAVRDSVDRNRNLVFYRARDNCQTLTQKDQCLELSGPSRAVVLEDPVTIEVDLKVKGAIESKDTDLSLLAVSLTYSGGSGSCPFEYTRKHCTLEFMLGEIVSSVEATIFIQVIDGSWPDGFHGQFAAHTTSVDHEKVILLEFGHDKMVPVSADGIMKLSRHVVSVEVVERSKFLSEHGKMAPRLWKERSRSRLLKPVEVIVPFTLVPVKWKSLSLGL